MRLSFRLRIVLTLIPLLVLLGVLGGVGTALLYRLGNRIDLILRENYESVVYMQKLREATERIDSSFQFALAGELKKALDDYEPNWRIFRESLDGEQHNITLPGEQEAVDRLTALAEKYRKQGDYFYLCIFFPSLLPGASALGDDYFGKEGLYTTFTEIKDVSGAILAMNQQNMKEEEAHARRTAQTSLIGFTAG